MKSILLALMIAAVMACRWLGAADYEVVYDPKPDRGLPFEAGEEKIFQITNAPASLPALLGSNVYSVKLRYFRECWKTPAEAQGFLNGLLTNQNHTLYSYIPWAQLVEEPYLECSVNYRNGYRGRLLLWDWVGCVQGIDSRWWFLTFSEDSKTNGPTR